MLSQHKICEFFTITMLLINNNIIAACDPKCASGCSATGAGKCDATCYGGYGVDSNFTCQRKCLKTDSLLSIDVSQGCCLGLAVRLTMATSRFLSLTYCQLVVVVVWVVFNTWSECYAWSPWQRH